MNRDQWVTLLSKISSRMLGAGTFSSQRETRTSGGEKGGDPHGDRDVPKIPGRTNKGSEGVISFAHYPLEKKKVS